MKPEGLAFVQLQYTDTKGIWKPMEKHNLKVAVENGILKGLGSPAPYVKGNYTDGWQLIMVRPWQWYRQTETAL